MNEDLFEKIQEGLEAGVCIDCYSTHPEPHSTTCAQVWPPHFIEDVAKKALHLIECFVGSGTTGDFTPAEAKQVLFDLDDALRARGVLK